MEVKIREFGVNSPPLVKEKINLDKVQIKKIQADYLRTMSCVFSNFCFVDFAFDLTFDLLILLLFCCSHL